MPIENKSGIKLSIAIPSYNGSQYIREALDSIVCQLNEIDDYVEIVMSDNASTDQTPEIIKEYQQKHSFIKYFRNNENLGPDANFDLAVRRSTGEFVWLFSDDDKLKPGAIKKVLDVLKKHPELAAIFVNSRNYDYNSKQYDSQPSVKIQKDTLFQSADDFLSNLRINAAFVSSDIVKRSLWKQASPEIYIGTGWIQYAALLTLIRSHHSYCIAEPYVMHMQRGGIRSDDSLERFMKRAITLMEVLNGLRGKGYGKRSVSKVKEVMLHHLPMEIIVYKKNGLTLKKSLIKNMIAQFKFYPSFWMVDLPLLVIPNFFHKIVFKIYKLRPINKAYGKIKNKFYSYFH